MSNQPPLVLIEWPYSGQPVLDWQWLDALTGHRPHRCIPFGFLVQDNEDTKVLAAVPRSYMDLNSAIDLANAIHSHVGLGPCDDDQLAAWSQQSAKPSTFRVQIYAARTFGILEGEGGKHKLGELGRMVVDPNQVQEGRARAFLAVPLYKAVFEKYKSGVLPAAAALELDFAARGVPEKQKERARQIFERSADQAGFFEHGKNRLVMPGIALGQPVCEDLKVDITNGNGGSGSGGNGGGRNPLEIDPIIRGLLARLPKTGDVWPESERTPWLELLKGSFKLIYKDKEASN